MNRNKVNCRIVVLLSVILINLCSGQIQNPDSAEVYSGSFPGATFTSIGLDVFTHKYEEFSGSDTLMEEEGTFFGFVLNHYRRPWISTEGIAPDKNKNMYGFEGEIAFGYLDYDGALQDDTPYSMNDIEDILVDVRGLYGFDNKTDKNLNTIYLGIGYRYLRDDSSSDPAGYLRKSNYFYLPVGVKMQSLKNNDWALGGTLEFDLLLFGLQKSIIDGYDYSNNQTSGYGLRAALNLQKESGKSLFAIQPFARYWHIDKSDLDSTDTWVEPKNRTLQFGIQLVAMY